ncbi:MAG: hypothetical protein ACRDAM_17625 [Casimicrobium sp.]
MATSSSPTTHFPDHHDGLERLIDRADIVKDLVDDASHGKRAPSLAVGLTIMALVTLTARALDQAQVSFVTELIALSAVALFAFVFLSRTIRTVARTLQRLVADTAANFRRARADERMWAYAAQDRRVMNEILWAKNRDESTLVSESRVTAHPSQKQMLGQRRIPSPIFTKYY